MRALRMAAVVGCSLAIAWALACSPPHAHAQHRPAAQTEKAYEPEDDATPAGPRANLPRGRYDALDAPVATNPTGSSEGDADVDARLHTLDRVLADLKRPTRAFLYTWLTIQAISIAYSVTLAVQADDNATRGNNIVTASFAATSMSGLLLAPSPGRYASREYRALPQATSEEKRHKLDQGERWLQRQARSDALGTWWVRHVLTALGAAGAGVGLALGYENNLEGAVRVAVSTFVAGELLIWTRPTRSIRYARQHLRSNEQPPQLSLAPLADRYAQGLSLVGRF